MNNERRLVSRNSNQKGKYPEIIQSKKLHRELSCYINMMQLLRLCPVQHIFIFHLFNSPCLVFPGVCSFLQEDNCLLVISRRNILLFTFTSSLSEETSKRLVTPTKLTFISNFQNKRNSARQLKIGAYASIVSKNGFHSKLICPTSLPPREKKLCLTQMPPFFSAAPRFFIEFWLKC